MMSLIEKAREMLDLLDVNMWTYVVSDMVRELRSLPMAALLGILAYLVFWVMFGRRLNWRHKISAALFLIYMFAVFYITLWEREAGSRQAISLTLWETLGGARANAYVIENAILFIPFGVLSACLWRPMRNPLLSILIGAVCSLGIEVVQLVTERGFFQVDDIVMNSLGAGVGCLVYLIGWGICWVSGRRRK